jgi:glycosyltransferase involved in cell wall biosynthesis
MKIIAITNTIAPDKLGGLERYVRELSAELVRQQQDVTVFAKASGGVEPGTATEQDGVEVARYAPPAKSDPLFAAKYPFAPVLALRKVIEPYLHKGSLKSGVVLHGHFPVSVLPLALRNIPYVYTLHAPVWRELLGERQASYRLPVPVQGAAVQGLRTAESLILRRARTVITLSEFIHREGTALAPAMRHTLIPGGLDTTWFTPEPAEPMVGAPALFCARRLVERTGVELLVRAVALLKRDLPGIHAHIAGDGPLRESLVSLAEDLGVSENITFMGRISEEALRQGYRACDLAITPTLYLEGFGLSTAEALACGAPAVVTPAGANPELVDPIDPAAVADAADAPSLAAAIARVWRDRPALEAYRAGARDRVHPAMAWPGVAERHVALYRGFAQQ